MKERRQTLRVVHVKHGSRPCRNKRLCMFMMSVMMSPFITTSLTEENIIAVSRKVGAAAEP